MKRRSFLGAAIGLATGGLLFRRRQPAVGSYEWRAARYRKLWDTHEQQEYGRLTDVPCRVTIAGKVTLGKCYMSVGNGLA